MPEDHREDHRDQRRDGADLERVAPAVEQPHRDVAAVGVGAEEEVAECQVGPIGMPGQADDVLGLPPTLTVPVMFSSSGPMCAMSCE